MPKQTWTREELRQLLMDYDAASGSYPETEYQGLDVWDWLNRDPAQDDDLGWLNAIEPEKKQDALTRYYQRKERERVNAIAAWEDWERENANAPSTS
jgi:hypothetical protein